MTYLQPDVSMTDPARGQVGFVMELEGENPDVQAPNWLMGVRARLDAKTVGGLATQFRRGQDTSPPFTAGRYLVSATSSAGGSIVVKVRMTGLKRDTVVRLHAIHATKVFGGSAVLSGPQVAGAPSAREPVSRSGTGRVFGMSGMRIDYTGSMQAFTQECVVGPEEDCTLGYGSLFQTTFPGKTVMDETSYLTPLHIDSAQQLSAKQELFGGAVLSSGFGYGILINAPLPRTRR